MAASSSTVSTNSELVVVHQEVDSIAVRPAAEAVVKLFFTVDGERGVFSLWNGQHA